MSTGVVEDLRVVMILVDDESRQESSSRVRQVDRDRAGVEVEHAGRIDRVAVEAHDQLPVDRSRFPSVLELAERSVLDLGSHVDVGLGPDEIVRRNEDAAISSRLPPIRTGQIGDGRMRRGNGGRTGWFCTITGAAAAGQRHQQRGGEDIEGDSLILHDVTSIQASHGATRTAGGAFQLPSRAPGLGHPSWGSGSPCPAA